MQSLEGEAEKKIAIGNLLNELGTTVPRERPLEARAEYRRIATRWMSASVGYPSPGVKSIKASVMMAPTMDAVKYACDIEWKPEAIAVFKTLSHDQVYHRSRDITLSCGPLMINEFQRRNDKVSRNWHHVQTLQSMINDRDRDEILQVIAQVTKEHWTIDYDHFMKHVRDHWDSSFMPGLKYSLLEDITPEEVKQLGQAVFDALFNLFDFAMTQGQCWLDRPFYLGIRARAESMDGYPLSLRCTTSCDEKTRDRPVNYRPVVSMVTAFLNDKPLWYKRIIDAWLSIIDFPYEVHYPMIEGGMIYHRAREWFNEGLNFFATDMGACEANVIYVLGAKFGMFATMIDGWVTLASGVFVTSLLDSLVSTLGAILLCRGDDKLIILGDDISRFTKSTTHRSFGETLEHQVMDTNVKFILGLAYGFDKEFAPRICGIKVTNDRSDRRYRWPLHVGYWSEMDNYLGGRSDPDQLRRWLDLYLGQVNGRDIDEVMKAVTADNFRAGSDELIATLNGDLA